MIVKCRYPWSKGDQRYYQKGSPGRTNFSFEIAINPVDYYRESSFTLQRHAKQPLQWISRTTISSTGERSLQE